MARDPLGVMRQQARKLWSGKVFQRLACVALVAFCPILSCKTVFGDTEGRLGSNTAQPHLQPSAAPLGAAQSAPPRAAAPPKALRIAAWNIAWLHRQDNTGPVQRGAADYARLAGYAARLDADVIALQEVDGASAAARVFNPERYTFHFAAGGGAQRTGFAVRKGLQLTPHADYHELDVGGLREGADLSVQTAAGAVRLLAVHLKSGCLQRDLLQTDSNACRKLALQLPQLEHWIDARASEGTAFAVLGDFNRRWTDGDVFFDELDDGNPPEADLESPTRRHRSHCWQQEAHLVDHLVLSRSLNLRVAPGSFELFDFDPEDRAFRRELSDHCPLALTLLMQ